MPRIDAQENKDRILAIARIELAKSATASLNQIAQKAEVGPGTLYRHFPTRESLVLAVYQQEVQKLVGSAPTLLKTMTPLEALHSWTTDLVHSMLIKHGLGDALSPSLAKAINNESYEPVIEAITTMLDAGKRDKTIRQDANAADFLMLTGSLWRAADNDNAEPQRMLALILDGLKAQG